MPNPTLLALALTLALTAPAAAHHPFSEDAGFQPGPVTLEAHRDSERAARYWNTAAGWPLIRITEGPADITIHPSGTSRSWAIPHPDPLSPYESCEIRHGGGWLTLAHEVGHCLGLADHLPAHRIDEQAHNNPADCSHPYRGVMSHCRWAQNHDADRRALANLGYPTVDPSQWHRWRVWRAQ